MIDLEMRAFGLDTPKLQHVHRLLHDYDERLSLRRIDPSDPVLNFTRKNPGPPHEFGVWEDNVAPGQRPWVFTVPAMSVDERLLARIIENDLRRHGASERMARLEAHDRAVKASQLRAEMERREERHEEMLALGDLFRRKDVIRHTFADGTTKIIGNDAGMRDVRSTPRMNRTIRFAKPRG